MRACESLQYPEKGAMAIFWTRLDS